MCPRVLLARTPRRWREQRAVHVNLRLSPRHLPACFLQATSACICSKAARANVCVGVEALALPQHRVGLLMLLVVLLLVLKGLRGGGNGSSCTSATGKNRRHTWTAKSTLGTATTAAGAAAGAGAGASAAVVAESVTLGMEDDWARVHVVVVKRSRLVKVRERCSCLAGKPLLRVTPIKQLSSVALFRLLICAPCMISKHSTVTDWCCGLSSLRCCCCWSDCWSRSWG